MQRRWKRSDITDEMVCRAYLPQMERRAAEAHLDIFEILEGISRRICSGVDEPFADEVLQRQTGAPWKVIYAAMDRASDRGLIEYGVTMRSGWLTEAGKALLAQKSQPDEISTATA